MRVLRADELDRSPSELDRARGGTDLAGELGCPGAEFGEVKPGELGRVRHRLPERERPLEMCVRLREAEDGLCLACRVDRRGERLCASARRLPVRRELRRRRSSAARELVGQLRVQFLALAGQDRRVDRLRQQRVPEPEAPRLRLGDQDAALHGRAERVAQGAVGQLHGRAEQRVADFASGRRGQAQHVLRRVIEAGDALQQQVAQCLRELHTLPARRGEKLFGEEGVALGAGGDRVCHCRGQRRTGVGRRAAPLARRARADRARVRAPSRSAGPPPQAFACARPTRARLPGRSQATEPAGRRGCARGRRPGRSSRYRPSAGPRARAAPVRKRRTR